MEEEGQATKRKREEGETEEGKEKGGEQEEKEEPEAKKRKHVIPAYKVKGPNGAPRVKKHACLFNTADKNKRGLLVTCTQNRETQAISNVMHLLHHYVKQLYPDLPLNPPQATVEEEEEEEGEATTETGGDSKEKEQSKAAQRKEVGPFSVYSSGGVRGLAVVTIENERIDSKLLVSTLLSDPQLPQLKRYCLFVSRLIPMDKFCVAKPEDVANSAKALIEAHPLFAGSETVTYAIIFESRNNDLVEKKACIDAIARLVPSHHKVNLTAPTLVIIVEIFKSVCGMGICQDYYKLKKFNLQQFVPTAPKPKKKEIK